VTAAPGRSSLGESLRATAPAWLASRAIVLVAYLVASQAIDRGWIHRATAKGRVQQGLLGWDAGWYRAVATRGYGSLGRESTRFFPLWPELVRSLHLLGVPVTWALVGGASLLWWAALVAVDQLGVSLGMDARRRTTTIWLLCLVPGAVATVFAYSEPLLVLLVAVVLALLYRTKGRTAGSPATWLLIAALGIAIGLTRPVGVLVAAPVAVEAWRRRGRGLTLATQVLAAVGPLVGIGGYLLWVRHQFGDALLPLRVQTEAGHHGALTNPISGLVHGFEMAAQGHLSAVMHLPWVALALVALVAGARKVPWSATLYGGLVVGLALAGQNLDSFERYLLAAPTLFFVAAGWLGRRWLRVSALLALAAGLLGTSVLVFADCLVP